jgi:hypothetical protein
LAGGGSKSEAPTAGAEAAKKKKKNDDFSEDDENFLSCVEEESVGRETRKSRVNSLHWPSALRCVHQVALVHLCAWTS